MCSYPIYSTKANIDKDPIQCGQYWARTKKLWNHETYYWDYYATEEDAINGSVELALRDKNSPAYKYSSLTPEVTSISVDPHDNKTKVTINTSYNFHYYYYERLSTINTYPVINIYSEGKKIKSEELGKMVDGDQVERTYKLPTNAYEENISFQVEYTGNDHEYSKIFDFETKRSNNHVIDFRKEPHHSFDFPIKLDNGDLISESFSFEMDITKDLNEPKTIQNLINVTYEDSTNEIKHPKFEGGKITVTNFKGLDRIGNLKLNTRSEQGKEIIYIEEVTSFDPYTQKTSKKPGKHIDSGLILPWNEKGNKFLAGEFAFDTYGVEKFTFTIPLEIQNTRYEYSDVTEADEHLDNLDKNINISKEDIIEDITLDYVRSLLNG